MRRLLYFLGLFALLVAALLAWPGSATAHAYLDRADPPPDSVLPTSPDTIQLWFTEPLEPNFSEIVIMNSAGQPISTAKSQIGADGVSMTLDLGNLSEGSYTVTWRTLSTADGHAARGFYSLTIGQAAPAVPPSAPTMEASGPPLPLQALVRWLTFVAQALLIGVLLFQLIIWLPTLARFPALDAAPVQARLRRLSILALILLAVSLPLALLVQAAIAADASLTQAFGQPMIDVLTSTRTGLIWEVRVILSLMLAVFVLWPGRAPRQDRIRLLVCLAPASALLLTTSLTGHNAAVPTGAELGIAADWLHLLATSAWVGGLISLLLTTSTTRPAPTGLASALVGRFSALALFSVGTLLLTGIFSSLLHITDLTMLLDTDYGRSLSVKLLLLLPMLATGAYNWRRLRPALDEAAKRGARLTDATIARLANVLATLRRSVRIEWALGLLILLATGFLTSTSPMPTAMTMNGLRLSQPAGDNTLILTISPAQPGPNSYQLTVDGPAASSPAKALLRLSPLDQELGELEVELPQTDNGHFAGEGRQLSITGQWQAEVIVRREGQDDVRTAYRFSIPPQAAATGSRDPILHPTLAAGLLLVIAAISLLIAGLARGRRRVARPLLGTGAGILALGLYLAVVGALGATDASPPVRNPFPPTTESLAVGRQLYSTYCLSCHGADGRGDGPAAAGLPRPPANLVQHVPAHTDSELYRTITQGLPTGGMPAFAGRLTEDQRWHLINYIRTFEPTPTSSSLPIRNTP